MSAKFPRGGGGAGPFLARSLNTIIQLLALKHHNIPPFIKLFERALISFTSGRQTLRVNHVISYDFLFFF